MSHAAKQTGMPCRLQSHSPLGPQKLRCGESARGEGSGHMPPSKARCPAGLRPGPVQGMSAGAPEAAVARREC